MDFSLISGNQISLLKPPPGQFLGHLQEDAHSLKQECLLNSAHLKQSDVLTLVACLATSNWFQCLPAKCDTEVPTYACESWILYILPCCLELDLDGLPNSWWILWR